MVNNEYYCRGSTPTEIMNNGIEIEIDHILTTRNNAIYTALWFLLVQVDKQWTIARSYPTKKLN